MAKTAGWAGFRTGALRLALCLLPVLGPALPAQAAEPLRVAAASDLRSVWLALSTEFKRHTEIEVSPSFAASGKLSQQIEQGAPFDVFLSADQDFVERLQAQGLTQGTPVQYTRGQLGLWVREDSRIEHLHQLGERLQGKLVMANPRHAPYGMRAEEVLRGSGQWEQCQSHLVLGENVAQAAQLVISGEAEAALLATSYKDEVAGGRWLTIDPGLHRPLWQVGVMLHTERRDAAQQWLDFLLSEPAQVIFRQRGFLPLDSAPSRPDQVAGQP
ncbi:molybdate ABC transporter substrate-binding protein [Pseudomarimonas arenosa]|uniref:Molybdate ABC transporter substrate-binding protein n=1 Tax=Pseudomarimonas arenosa TaxID=2774145 RepID=A0AAW3ZJQ2_9GAMM|nr:molybdate ABC transporter substrate-binding protein [Pseudomarimonas arenosa]MBD8526338.1 molybdate ABC transporter substrate-binding protein [Pseudomarimonas arenosa]